MQHNAAFHHGLHCLLRLKQPSGTGIHHNSEKPTWVSPILMYQYVWENPSEYKGLRDEKI